MTGPTGAASTVTGPTGPTGAGATGTTGPTGTTGASAPLTAWTNVAASGTANLAGGSTTTYYTTDSTGGSTATINLPSSASAAEGQVVLISLRGATAVNGVTVNPGAGNNMADPNNAGQFTGVGVGAVIRTVGAIFKLKYSLAGTPTNTWIEEG